MKFADTGGGVDFEPAPSGTHIARCIRIIDLGTAHDDFWDKDKHEVFFMWEIPAEMKTYTNDKNEEVVEPFTVSKFYTMSLSDKAHLRRDLESWRSKPFTEEELAGFNPVTIMGAPCMINVIHKDRKSGGINAFVQTITSMPSGLECPPMVHSPVFFSLEDFQEKEFDALSKGIKARIMKSHEYKHMQGEDVVVKHPVVGGNQQISSGAEVNQPEFDDIPF